MEIGFLADMSSTLALVVVILKVAIGLGAVIFVHELGHFLVAKACGVKCEKFMIGFDIGGVKMSRKWGETEYGIGILPLGGYVKMLGQDDDPAHIAEQLKKSEVAAGSEEGVEVVGPKGDRYVVDRRSYLAKSVPQRMAIISAGVVMNVIFAVVFAVVAYGIGVPYMPCIVSDTVPGSPAWLAGIEPGDEIIKLGDRENPSFTQLRGGVTLGDLEQGIPCIVRRAADGREVEVTITPEQGKGLAKVGIAPPISLTLSSAMPTLHGSPAARATLVEPAAAGEADDQAGFQGGDEIIRVGDVAINEYRDLVAQLAQHSGQSLRVTVRRPLEPTKADAAAEPAAEADARPSRELAFEVPPQSLRRVGLVMKMGPISAIQPGSPAAESGLKVGDTIVAVDGQSLDAADSMSAWDPVTLPERIRAAAVAGRSVALGVLRPSPENDTRQPIELTVTPRVPTLYHSAIPPRAPMGVPALGLAYQIESEVAAVIAGSPAAEATSPLEPGDRLTAAKFIFPKDSKGKQPDPFTIELGAAEPNWLARFVGGLLSRDATAGLGADELSWPAVFDHLQSSPAGTQIELTFRRDDKWQTTKLTPVAVAELFAAERGFGLIPIERIRRASTFGEQIRYGWEETTDALTMVYRFLSKLGTQVPLTALGGPVMIAQAAGYSAYEGMAKLLVFLTMLSANLAVINFLPIPLLDGGHMVFLAYEGVRGRPASERFVVALHMVGFAFIVGLMLFVLALDVNLIPRNL